MRIHSSLARAGDRRRGIVLLVVLAMLSLFAAVALSFVFYADSEANNAQLARAALQIEQPAVDQEALAAYFLNQLIYPSDNVYSAMRGWELARSIYGYNPGHPTNAPTNPSLNYTPYNGVGRDALSAMVQFNTNITKPVTPPLGPTFFDNFDLINYQRFDNPYPSPLGSPDDPYMGVLRIPEFFGKQGDANFRYVGGANPPWTSYDTNSIFLAEVDSTGKVLMPSFGRPWTQNKIKAIIANYPAPMQAALYQTVQKYASLRPDPVWNPQFVTPDSEQDPSGIFYDVKNLDVGPGNYFGGNNDSTWMDIGFPALTAPNGKRYKPMFAPLIMDLSNKLHLWAHGNNIGQNSPYTHVSNLGLGPTEVNLASALFPPGDPLAAAKMKEMQSLFWLKYGGLYGTVLDQPQGAPTFRPGPFFTPTDVNGLDPGQKQSTLPYMTGFSTVALAKINKGTKGPVALSSISGITKGGFPWIITVGSVLVIDTGATQEQVQVATVAGPTFTTTANFTFDHLPGVNGVPVAAASMYPFPIFQTNGLGWTPTNGPGWDNTAGEGAPPPLGLNLFTALGPNASGNFNMLPLPMSNQEALLRYYGTNSPATTSEIFRRLPNTLGNANPRSRSMLTIWNTYMDRIAAAPIGYDPSAPTAYRFNPAVNPGYPIMSGTNITPGPNLPNSYSNTPVPAPGSEYGFTVPIRPFPGAPIGIREVAGLVTVNTAAPHNFAVGQTVFINNVTNPAYNSTVVGRVITSVPNNLSFQYRLAAKGALPPSGGGYAYVGDWRSNLGSQLRVDLSRKLVDFPLPTLVPNAAEPNSKLINTGNPAVMAQYQLAMQQRQEFAADIYHALVRVTGAQDPNTAPVGSVNTASADYKAARWLAQMAVNIVDYIDNDDYITPFNWNRISAPGYFNSNANGPSEWVFGTELPRLVLNEVYPQYEASGTLNVWAELHNPFYTSVGTYPLDGGNAKLRIGGVANPVYHVLVCYGTGGPTPANLRRQPVAATATADNKGDPAPGSVKGTSNTWGNRPFQHEVLPATGRGQSPNPLTTLAIAAAPGGAVTAGPNVTITTTANHGLFAGEYVVIKGVPGGYDGTFRVNATPTAKKFTYTPTVPPVMPTSGGGNVFLGTNDGYYVLGPTAAFAPGFDPFIPVTDAAAGMSVAGWPANKPPVTVVLQRLANEHLPLNNNQTVGGNPNPLYNPYVTVDYLDSIPVNDNTVITNLGTPTAQSYGRKQPYTADSSQVVAQVAGSAVKSVPAMPALPKNSFYGANGTPSAGTLDANFYWLTHLDRPPVNSMELRYVSQYRPHELTQQFVTAAGIFQHRTGWDRSNMVNNKLHRALDVLGVPNPMVGSVRGGRWQGPINLNTLMDHPEIVAALCDAQTSQQIPLFNAADVTAVYNKLIISRSNGAGLTPNSEGNPFRPLASGDVDQTWLRQGGIFDITSANNQEHPYRINALMQKIANNITTTSNVFAVWWTVGYFEVVDETCRPVKLGAEIGRSENRHIRNRFFAIVDRSALQLFNATTSAFTPGALQWKGNVNYPIGTQAWFDPTGGTAPLLYQCIQGPPMVGAVNTGIPPTNTAYWQPITMKDQPVTLNAGSIMTPTGTISSWLNSAVYPIGSAITFPGNGFVYYCVRENGPSTAGGVQQPIIAATGTINATYWQQLLQPGMILEIDTGPASETIVVKTVQPGGTSFTADFTRYHFTGAQIILRGNAGPRKTYNPRQDTGVVLHLSVIQ